MKCFKVTANEVENSVTIDGIVFSPQQCTAEEEIIILREMEKEWYIHSDYDTTTEYYELSSSSSGSVMVYELQTEDVVLYNNQVIGFLISGYHYDSQIKGKYFPIQDHENFNYKFESHRSYDHGDGDVETISYCSLRKRDIRETILMNDYVIRYEEDGNNHYKRITHEIVRVKDNSVAVKVDEFGTWIDFDDVGKKIKTKGLLSKVTCYAILVKKSDLIELNKLVNEYCIRWERRYGTIEYKDISHDCFREKGTLIEIDLGSWAATDRLRISEMGKKVRVGGDYATLVKKSELSEFNTFIDEYCICWEKDDTVEYEAISYNNLIKKEKSIGVKIDTFCDLLLCEAGKKANVRSKNATVSLVKKADLVELNKLANEYCICWEDDGEVYYEDISYNNFVEDSTGLKVKIGNWQRLFFDEIGNKILVSTNRTVSLVQKNKL